VEAVAVARGQIAQAIADGPFAASWESLADYRVPAWYEDGKFGIFIHWGPYAVPAFGNEWYPRKMYQRGTPEFAHHVETYGPQSAFGYKDFIPRFTAEKFDPDQWAALFRRAGAQFVVPVAEHHDGFAMYDCAFSGWNAVAMGPRRDIIGELAAAVRRQWLVFGISSHRAEHWWFFDEGMRFDSDVRDPRYADLYGPAQPRDILPPNEQFLEDWLVRTCELVDKYQPQLVWFDWWIEQPAFASYLRRFAAYYYNRAATWDRGVAINHKYGAFPEGTAVFDVERGQLADRRPRFWQTDTSVAKTSWGYVAGQDYKTVGDLVGDLVDIVSKNGALLLNIGPRPDGTIPAEEEALLIGIGRWLALNGEAIYGTRPWHVFGEGPTEVREGPFTDTKRSIFTGQDIRFTTRVALQHGAQVETLYATVLAWPDTGVVTMKSLAVNTDLFDREIATVELLGCDESLRWVREAAGLTIQLPAERPGEHAFVFKITAAEPA
jgi:alpha-L-fucosidase